MGRRLRAALAALALSLLPAGARPGAGGGEIAWGAPVAVASGPGDRGPWRQNASAYDYVDDPAVALDARGDLAVAWVDQRTRSVRLQRYGPDGRPRLDAPADVSRSPAVFSWLPRVAFGGDDGSVVAVLWQEIVFSGGSHGGDVFFARSTDGGRTFSPPVNLSRSRAGDGKGRLDARRWDNGSLDLVAGPGGALHAAWTTYEGDLWACRSGDGGASFSAPVRVAGPRSAGPARGPSLAAGAGGAVHLAWTVGEDPAADVHVAASRDGGRTFAPPRVAARTPGRSDAPRLAVDPAGAVHLVFSEGLPGAPPRVVHAAAAPGTLAFSAPRPVHGDAGAGAVFPDLAVGSDGAVYVLSETLRDGEAEPRGFRLSVSTDGGRSFAPPAEVAGTGAGPATNGGQQGNFMRRLAVGRDGAIVVGFSTFQRGVASRVAVVRGERGGG